MGVGDQRRPRSRVLTGTAALVKPCMTVTAPSSHGTVADDDLLDVSVRRRVRARWRSVALLAASLGPRGPRLLIAVADLQRGGGWPGDPARGLAPRARAGLDHLPAGGQRSDSGVELRGRPQNFSPRADARGRSTGTVTCAVSIYLHGGTSCEDNHVRAR